MNIERNFKIENLKREKIQEMLNFFSLTETDLRGKSILDVGAGSGYFIEYLRNNLGNDKAFALDINNTRDDHPEWFIESDIQNAPLADSSFDIIISRNVFSWFIDDEYPAYLNGIPMDYKLFIAKVIDLLKENGIFKFNSITPEKIIESSRGQTDPDHIEYLNRRSENCKKIFEHLNSLQNQGIYCDMKNIDFGDVLVTLTKNTKKI